MQGTLQAVQSLPLSPGIIPADAGSTKTHDWTIKAAGDHPRGCGEHDPHTGTAGALLGSSPRMRGALAAVARAAREVGIIPADAGSTHLSAIGKFPVADHPRGCGEHDTALSPYHPA